jgi:hypothetical protein
MSDSEHSPTSPSSPYPKANQWISTDEKTYYPSDVDGRTLPDSIADRYRRASNESRGQVPHDATSLAHLWERMMWFLEDYIDTTLKFEPGPQIVHDALWTLEKRPEGIFLEGIDFDDIEKDDVQALSIPLLKDVQELLDRKSPYFIGRWIEDERFLAPPIADVAYELGNYVRLAIASITWKEEFTLDGESRTYIKWDLPPSGWLMSRRSFLSLEDILFDTDPENRALGSDAMNFLIKQAQADEEEEAARQEDATNRADGQYKWQWL